MDVILRIFSGLASRWRIFFHGARGLQIQGHVRLAAIEIPQRAKSILLRDGAALDRGVVLLSTSDEARIDIGPRTYINRHTMIDANASIEIGAETMIGPFCYLTDHDHAVAPGLAPAAGALVSAPTRIGERCWLGANVTVLKGVTIGDGTVVGAGSIVTKSLPAGVIAVGNPARVIKSIGA